MIVVMEPGAAPAAVEAVIAYLVRAGCDVHRSSGDKLTILGVVGKIGENDRAVVGELDGVAKVVAVTEPYKLASRRFRKDSTIVDGDWGSIGGPHAWLAVEPIGYSGAPRDSEAPAAAGGEAEPTSTTLPYEVAAGRPFDAAVTRSRHAAESVGSLSCLSLHPQPIEQKWPVSFVVRDASWGPEAWISAAEHELERGATRVVLLEAGGSQPGGSRTLEVKAIALTKSLTHLPLVVDVPRIAQQSRYCASVASAALAAGADGVILRAWAGDSGVVPRVPATLAWDTAVELANRLRAMSELLKQ